MYKKETTDKDDPSTRDKWLVQMCPLFRGTTVMCLHLFSLPLYSNQFILVVLFVWTNWTNLFER